MAHVYFQASLLAEREGHWVLARNVRRAREGRSTRSSPSTGNVGRLLNNLGGLNFLLGKPDDAIRAPQGSVRASPSTWGATTTRRSAVSSLAQVHLRTGDLEQAEEQARHALRLLEGRDDLLDEIGNAQLVLGRALLEQGRLDEAERPSRPAERDVRPALVGQSSRRGVGRTGRPRDQAGDDREAAHFTGAPPRLSRTSGSKDERR